MQNILHKISIQMSVKVLAASFFAIATVVAFAPRVVNQSKAESCTIYQDPVFNPFPVTFGSNAGTGCTDFPLVAARPLNSTPADYSLNMNAKAGDEFYVRIYVHNGAAQGLNTDHTTMNNIVANTSIADNGSNHTISVNLSAGSTNDGFIPQSKSSQVTVNTAGDATLEIVPGSGSIYDYTGTLLQSGVTLGGATQLGSQQACFDFSRQILFKVKVVAVTPPVQTTLSANANSSTFCVYSKGEHANDTGSWTVNGSSNLAGQKIVWSSTKNTKSTGEVNSYYNQNLDSNGNWSGQSDRPWSVNDIGTWTKTAKTFDGSQVTATAPDINFTVKDCSTTVTPPEQSNFTLTAQNFCLGQQPRYSITGTANLVGKTITWSSTFNGHATGENNAYAGQTIAGNNGLATWSDDGGTWINNRRFTSPDGTSLVGDVGQWTKTATINGVSQTASFEVKDCTPAPVYVPVICAPANQSAQTGQTVYFSASQGKGTYTWTGNSLKQTSGNSNSAVYNNAGTYTATVTDGQSSATCNVTVTATPPVYQPVQCTPGNQTINSGANANFSATGGNGAYSWTTNNGKATLGSTFNGSTFNAVFTQSGNVTVTSNGQSATCNVTVSVPQTVTYTAYASVTVSADASASCPNGTTATAHASASASAYATSNVSYDTAYNAAKADAENQANVIAKANAEAKATVSCPATPTVENFTVSATNICVGSPATYQFTGTANLAGKNISASTTFTPTNGSAQTTNNGIVGAMVLSGNVSVATLTGHVWTTADIGHYVRNFVISSQNQTATFNVIDCNPPVTPQLICNPNTTQTANVQQNVNFSATGGTGHYTWSAPSANVTSGNNSSFTTSYFAVGNYTVTVNDGSHTASCNVAITAPVQQTLQCTPPQQTANQNQSVYFAAIGGNGTYTWSAPSASLQSGNGNNFTTSYYNSGNQTVTVQSGGQTANCNVQILGVVPQQLICSPPNQTAYAGQTVYFSVYGGNGTYTWSAPGATQQYGNGSNFNTTFNNIGNQSVIVTSNGQTATCYAQILAQQILPANASITLSKRATNNTKGGDATQVVAAPDDYITYTLTASNSGNSPATNFVVTDDLSQVLPYASVSDFGGGTMTGNIISFPAQTIPAGGSISVSLQVRVNHFLANNLSYTMTNTYGNTLTIRINTPQVLGAFTAPATGANTGAIAFGAMLMGGFAIYKKRSLLSKLILNN